MFKISNFKIPTFRLKLQPSSGGSDKNLHRKRTNKGDVAGLVRSQVIGLIPF